MLDRLVIPVAIPKPDFILNLLADPLFFTFLLLILILFAAYLLVSRLLDLKSNVDRLEKLVKEVQILVEKNSGDMDSRLKDIEAKLAELHSRIEELEKRSARRTKRTD